MPYGRFCDVAPFLDEVWSAHKHGHQRMPKGVHWVFLAKGGSGGGGQLAVKCLTPTRLSTAEPSALVKPPILHLHTLLITTHHPQHWSCTSPGTTTLIRPWKCKFILVPVLGPVQKFETLAFSATPAGLQAGGQPGGVVASHQRNFAGIPS